MRVVSLLTILLFVTPTLMTSGSAEDGSERHRAEFLAHFPGLPLDAEARVHWNDDTYDLTLDEAADLHAERMLLFMQDKADDARGPAVAARAAAWGERNHGGNPGGNGEASTDPAPVLHAGTFILREDHRWVGSNPTNACSADGEHYLFRVSNPTYDPPSHEKYFGAGYSDVASYGEGTVIDSSANEVAHYWEPVIYSGLSDFFCTTAASGNGGFVLNQPTITGAVTSAV